MGIAVPQEFFPARQGRNGGIGLPGIGAPPVGPVGVAAQEMDGAPIVEPAGAALGGFSEVPQKAAFVALEQDALFHPLEDGIGMGHNVPVPFRVGQDGQVTPELELIQQVPGFQRGCRGQQFHQEIGGARQAVRPAFPGPGQVVEGVRVQAHLRPAVEPDGDAGIIRGLLELCQPFCDDVPGGTDAPAVEMGGWRKVPWSPPPPPGAACPGTWNDPGPRRPRGCRTGYGNGCRS